MPRSAALWISSAELLLAMIFPAQKSLRSSPVAQAFEYLLDDFTQRSFNSILHPAHLFYWLPTSRNRLHAKNFAVVRDALLQSTKHCGSTPRLPSPSATQRRPWSSCPAWSRRQVPLSIGPFGGYTAHLTTSMTPTLSGRNVSSEASTSASITATLSFLSVAAREIAWAGGLP